MQLGFAPLLEKGWIDPSRLIANCASGVSGAGRQAKIDNIKPPGHDLLWTGPEKGDVLLVGWGSTFGAIKAATLELRKLGLQVSAAHIRYLNPMPRRIGDLMKEFEHVIVPELNLGQLRMLLRARFLVDAKGINKVRGLPFTINELVHGVQRILAGGGDQQVDDSTRAMINASVSADVDSGG